MAVRIDYNIVIGNALKYLKKTYISKNLIYSYWSRVDELLPQNYYTYGNNSSFEDFYERYSFIVKRNGDTMIFDDSVYESGVLDRYFCIGIPKEISIIFKKAALSFLKLEENVNKYLKKVKKVEK